MEGLMKVGKRRMVTVRRGGNVDRERMRMNMR